MKKKEETKYLDKEWNEMNARLRAFLATGEQQELHKFRVQIKKLRAMLNLIEGTSRQQGLMKNFKPIRKIFKNAGQIRDAYTNLALSDRYELKNEQFEVGQQKIIEEGVIAFKSRGEKYLKSIKSSYKVLKQQLSGVDDKAIADFYRHQLEQIAAKLETSGFTEDMHTNRKLIKILVYNHKLAESALNGSLTFNVAYLDQLQEAIGQWHDNLIAEQLFSSPEWNDMPVVSKIKRKNASVKRSIKLLANDFLKKATTAEQTV